MRPRAAHTATIWKLCNRFLFMFQEPGQSVHISKANTFLQGQEEKSLHNRAPPTHAILYKHIRLLLKLSTFHVLQLRVEGGDQKFSFYCFCIGYYWHNITIIIIIAIIYNFIVLHPLDFY